MKNFLIICALFFLTEFTFAQIDDEDAHLNLGIGWNYGRYTNNNNIKAFSNYLNIKASSNGRHLTQAIDLNKFHQGIALNFGFESKKMSFYAQWHNGILSDELRYDQQGTIELYHVYEAFKFTMNNFSLSAAYGIKHLKIGGSVDFTNFKYFYKIDESDKNWLRQEKYFNIGVTGFLEINPIRFLKIKPYIQVNLFSGTFQNNSLTLPQYEFSMNYFSNFGAAAFIEIPTHKNNK